MTYSVLNGKCNGRRAEMRFKICRGGRKFWWPKCIRKDSWVCESLNWLLPITNIIIPSQDIFHANISNLVYLRKEMHQDLLAYIPVLKQGKPPTDSNKQCLAKSQSSQNNVYIFKSNWAIKSTGRDPHSPCCSPKNPSLLPSPHTAPVYILLGHSPAG